MSDLLSSREDDVLFDWDQLTALDTGECYLVALSDMHIDLLLSVIRFASWRTRWANAPDDFTQITDMVKELEHCLMSGCNVSQLVDVLGEGFDQLHTDMQALATKLDTIATAQATGSDLEDDLAMTWRQVESVATILGAAVAEAPLPL